MFSKDFWYNEIYMIEGEIVQFLIDHGYLFMFVLMIAEGPIVTMAAAFLASLDVFSVPAVLFVSIAGDLAGDVFWYAIGYRWGHAFLRGPGKYIGITEELVKKMSKYFDHHGGKTIFAVKSTTGLCLVTFVAAGMVRMPLKKFLTYSLLGGIIWSSTLVSLGYFFGFLYEEIARYITWAGWLIAALASVTFTSVILYKKKKAQKFDDLHRIHPTD